MKSKNKLEGFVKYCQENPEQRFWQALRNWSNYCFIYGSNTPPYKVLAKDLEDTFYIE